MQSGIHARGALRRDYLDGADFTTAERVLEALPGWIDDYNTQASHSGLGMRSPAEYRLAMDTVLT